MAVAIALAVSSGPVMAAGEPRLPCGISPVPAYAEPDAPPHVQVWNAVGLGRGWALQDCARWLDRRVDLLVAVAGSFGFAGSADDLLARFGAVSSLKGARYWSVSDGAWRVLITDASALSSPDLRDRRADFTPAELAAGTDVAFAQRDSRSTRDIVYRLRVIAASADRLVIVIENASPVRYYLLTLFEPGDLTSTYFLDRLAPGVWGFYGMTGVARANSLLTGGRDASYVNRAVAFYRHIAGIQTDREPPAER